MARQAWKNRFCTMLFLGVASTQAAHAVPVLSLAATPDPAVVGSSVAVNVLIAGAVDVYAYQFTLAFNPAILQVSSTNEGSFLGTGGGLTFFDGGVVDNALGTLSFSFNTLLGTGPGVTGSGTVERINFSVTRAGTSTLAFSDVQVLDSTLATITTQFQNRSLQAVAVPEPATLLMFGIGLAGVAGLRARKGRA